MVPEKKGRFKPLNFLYGGFHTLKLLVYLLRYKPKIVHLPVTSTYPGLLRDSIFISISKFFGAKVIGHLHGGKFHLRLNGSNVFVKNYIVRMLKKLDILIVLSKFWEDVVNDASSDINVCIIPNGIDDIFAREKKNYARAREQINVLFVGSLGQRKGVFDILKAVPLVKSKTNGKVQFIFAGSEEKQGEYEKIVSLKESLNIKEGVHFLGPVYGNEMVKLYSTSHIFLLPSYNEGLPMAILEAMSASLPVVSTPVGSISEVINHGENGLLIAPGNPAGIAEAILDLVMDPGLREAMGRRNERKVREKYLAKQMIFEIEKIYTLFLGCSKD
jgi:glycosyltransferase involved in cell wall biosynthesis